MKSAPLAVEKNGSIPHLAAHTTRSDLAVLPVSQVLKDVGEADGFSTLLTGMAASPVPVASVFLGAIA